MTSSRSNASPEMSFRLSDALYEGICLMRLEGRFTLGGSASAVQALIDRRIQEGVRFFVVDLLQLEYLDSSGLATLGYGRSRLSMRVGEFNVIYSEASRVGELFILTKLHTILNPPSTVEEAISRILNKPVDSVKDLKKCEERFLITFDERCPWPNHFVRDYADLLGTNPQSRLGYGELPDPEFERSKKVQQDSSPAVSSPKGSAIENAPHTKVSTRSIAFLLLFALIGLVGILASLVWAAKQISSTLVLTLIFSVSILFYLNIVVFVLMLSGYLSEKTAKQLLSGILGKVPGLKLWVPRFLAGKKP